MAPRIVTWIPAFFCMAAALSLPASAQNKGTGAGTGTGAGSASGTSTGTTGVGVGRGAPGNIGTVPSNPGTPNSTSNAPSAVPTPIYLMGKVTLEDGSPPPDLVTIERVCNGVTHTAGYADAQGQFSIELGNEQGVFQDATDGSGFGPPGGAFGSGAGSTGSGSSSSRSQERMLQSCELRAKLPGYRSQGLILAGRRPMDDPNIGVILLHREAAGEGNTVSATSLAAPKSAQKLFEKGIEQGKKQKFGDALASFQKALEIYPNYAAAWTELGKLQVAADHLDEARFAFTSAIKLDPKFVGPYVELSRLVYEAKHWPELSDLTARAMRLDPFDYPQLFLFNGIAHYNLRETDAAERAVKEAERLDSQHRFPETAHLYGLVLAQRHEYAQACDHLRAYLKMAPNADDLDTVRGQLATFEKEVTATSAAKQ